MRLVSVKQTVLALLATLYLTFAVGLPVFEHYCAGEHKQTSLLHTYEGCCGGEDTPDPESDPCCHDEAHLWQVDDSSPTAFKVFWPEIGLVDLPRGPVWEAWSLHQQEAQTLSAQAFAPADPPPLPGEVNRQAYLQTWRI